MYGLAISRLAGRDPTDVSLSTSPYGDFRAVRGLHKLVGAVELLLLTAQSSIAGMPGYGVDALARLSNLSLSDTAALQRVMSELVAELTRQLDRLTRNLPSADERPGPLTLDIVSVDGNELVVRLNLQSVAGQTAVYDLTLFTNRI